MTSTTKTLSAINALLGLWLFVTPFIWQTTMAAAWNFYLFGAGIAVLAAWNWSRATQGQEVQPAVSGIVGVLGLWIAVSPLFFQFATDLAWNAVISGLLVLAMGAYNAYEAGQHTPTERRARRV